MRIADTRQGRQQIALRATSIEDACVFGDRVDPRGQAVAPQPVQIGRQTLDFAHGGVMPGVVVEQFLRRIPVHPLPR